VIQGDPLFGDDLPELVVLTAARGLPAVFQSHTSLTLAGLMSYGADVLDAARIGA
jgi:hypothetical protein